MVAANLFLRPRLVGALAEYWLRHYRPPILLPAAVTAAAAAAEPGGWIASLLTSVLRGPTELALVARPGAAAEGRWLLWLQLIELAPGIPNTTLSLLVPFFTQQRFGALCLSLVRLFQHVREGWNVRSAELARAGTLAGECFYTSFCHLDVLERFYPRTLLVVEILYRFGVGLMRALPPHQQQSIGAAVLREAMAPLAGGGGGGDNDEPGLRHLHAILSDQCARDLGGALHTLGQLREALGAMARQVYVELRDTCGYPVGDLPEDVRGALPPAGWPERGAYLAVRSWKDVMNAMMMQS